MTYCYVAKSKSLQDWGHSVGISKHLYKVGITSTDVKDTISKMNYENYAGRNDWKLIMHDSIEEVEDSLIFEKINKSIDMIDPTYYPQIKEANGIFKVKLQSVEDNLLLSIALQNKEGSHKGIKVGAKQIAKYILDKIY
tara:strand:- start:346 stop:762 length:417 start_codon:yes stop_codon:yes gene_type:complete